MNETLKGVAHIGAELAAAKADLQREMERHRKTWRQLEQVTGLLRRWMSDEALDNPHAIYVASEAALSQQAEPMCTTCNDVGIVGHSTICPGCADTWMPPEDRAEPAPAQDEREAQQCLFVMREIGSMDAEDISGDDVDLRFEDADGRDSGCDVSIVDYAERTADVLERLLATRPAQTEQQPFLYANIEKVTDVCTPEFKAKCPALSANYALKLYAAPIAQTAPSCNHRFMYFGDQTKRRCADCYVVEGNEQTAPQPERSDSVLLDALFIGQVAAEKAGMLNGTSNWALCLLRHIRSALSATPSPAKRGDA